MELKAVFMVFSTYIQKNSASEYLLIFVDFKYVSDVFA